jgi:predicted phage terminase large subunit-like protein
MTQGLLYRVDPETARQALVIGALRAKYRRAAEAAAPSWTPLPHQVPPPEPWAVWILLGGRGAGKTAAGAHAVDGHARSAPCLTGAVPHRIGIVAPSHEDSVATCVRGETGLLSANPRIAFHPGAAKVADLTWPNGAEANLFGAFAPEDVERFRGPQHCYLWGDEFAAWRKLEEVWDIAAFGLRLGPHPQIVLTSTPKRRAKLRELMARPDTVVSHATTRANPHLPEARLEDLYRQYGGTTLGRQELDAEIIEDVEGALWNRAMIEHRHPFPKVYPKGIETPDFLRIIVAVDPAVTSTSESDETGIIVVAMGSDRRAYVLDDLSLRASPAEWARRAVAALRDHGGDRIVAEANNGGDLVSTVIGAVDALAPVTLVHAARGKRTRAEPVAALYEQGRVTHVRPFPDLEDQLCSYTGVAGEDSPDRMDALVWGLSELFDLRVDDSKVWGAGPQWGVAA